MDPILFHIGNFPIRAYGVFIILGFLVGLWRAMGVARRRLMTEPEGSRRRIDPDALFDVAFYGLLVGLIGARVLFVVLDWSDYAAHPIDAFKIWAGGLSLHGGLLFGILFMVWACRVWKRVPLLPLADLCATSWALAYSIGRFGCLFNGCCYGGPCNLPWGVRFPDEHNPGHLTPPSHPVPLYASMFNIVFFVWLVLWEKRKRRDGEIFWAYIAMYGFYRYVMEYFREGITSTYLIPSLHLTDTHIVSILMVAAGIAGIVWLRRRRPAYVDGNLPEGFQPLPPASRHGVSSDRPTPATQAKS